MYAAEQGEGWKGGCLVIGKAAAVNEGAWIIGAIDAVILGQSDVDPALAEAQERGAAKGRPPSAVRRTPMRDFYARCEALTAWMVTAPF